VASACGSASGGEAVAIWSEPAFPGRRERSRRRLSAPQPSERRWTRYSKACARCHLVIRTRAPRRGRCATYLPRFALVLIGLHSSRRLDAYAMPNGRQISNCPHRYAHLEPIHEDAEIRRPDLIQLQQIASGYPSRERFLTDLRSIRRRPPAWVPGSSLGA
jgi:hypothetical protein